MRPHVAPRSPPAVAVATRRGLMIAALIAAAPRPTRADPSPAERAATATADDSPLVARLLAETELHKEERVKQRLADYNRRNFRDFFGSELGQSGDMRGVKPETQAAIKKWLKENT